VSRVSQRIGGPLGRYAATGSAWWNPLRVTLLVGTFVYLSGVAFRLPCRITIAGQPPPDHFKYLCYSDIGLLYAGRGLLQGQTPYLDSGGYPVLEYPVLTGWFLELERLITKALGGLQGVGLTDQQQVDSTLIFVDVNTVLLGALFLIALGPGAYPRGSALGRDDDGRLTLRRRRCIDQLGHAGGGADRPRDGVLVRA